MSFSQWPFEEVRSTPLAAPDQVQLTWSAVFDVDTHVVLSCLRRVRWGTGLGSLLVREFDRCLLHSIDVVLHSIDVVLHSIDVVLHSIDIVLLAMSIDD